MKVAITANGPSVENQVDQRFGRAKYIIVYDTVTGDIQAHDNEVNLNAVQGAGIQTASNVAALGVEAVLTGHVGPNSFRVLSAAGIKVYTGVTGTIGQAMVQIVTGGITPVQAADVEGHWV